MEAASHKVVTVKLRSIRLENSRNDGGLNCRIQPRLGTSSEVYCTLVCHLHPKPTNLQLNAASLSLPHVRLFNHTKSQSAHVLVTTPCDCTTSLSIAGKQLVPTQQQRKRQDRESCTHPCFFVKMGEVSSSAKWITQARSARSRDKESRHFR